MCAVEKEWEIVFFSVLCYTIYIEDLRGRCVWS